MKFKHYFMLLGLIVAIICTGYCLWYIRPWMPMLAAELAICAMLLIGLGTLAIVYIAIMAALALWHWQDGKRVANRANALVSVAEHGSYSILGNLYIPPASVHMAALAPPQNVVPQNVVQALPSPQQEQYPHAPAFAAIQHLIQPGRLILGYNVEGPIYGDVSDLLSMAFVGKPGTGKSSALLYYLAMLLLVDASVYVFDPQGSLNEVADFLPYFGDFNEFAAPLSEIYAEIQEREMMWRTGRQRKGPMLILVDELPAIARWEQKTRPEYSLLELAEKIVLENRKHNVFVLLTGQSLPAEVLPTLTRDNLSSRLVFNSSDSHARMAGLDEASRKKLLPLLRKAQPGTAILDVSRRPAPDIAALPFTTVEDVRGIVEDSSGSDFQDFQLDGKPLPTNGATSHEQPEYHPEARFRVITGSLVNNGNEPSKPLEANGKDYRLSEVEQATLIATYKATGSIEKSLRAMGKGARYAKDASRILKQEGLIA